MLKIAPAFEVYTQICKEESNSIATESTLGTICLGPVGNVQGSYKCMSLRASKLIIRGDSSEIPATQDISYPYQPIKVLVINTSQSRINISQSRHCVCQLT
jgi:hypothetical protein